MLSNCILPRASRGCVIWIALFLGVAEILADPTGPIKTTKTVYAFDRPPTRPTSLVFASDGNFYGASAGGVRGFLFRVTSGGVFSIVHDFKNDRAGNPTSVISGKDGNLYAILDSGAIFKCSLSGSFNAIYSPGSAADATWLVQGSDGNIYGTTQSGGAANYGSIFRLSPSGVLTTIYSFTGGSDGSYPSELVEGAPGTFYGVSDSSIVFKITSSGTFNVVRDFRGTFEGGLANLVYGSDGNIYGAEFRSTQSSQPGKAVFRLTPNGDFTALYNFGSASINALIEGDGNLYCSTGPSEATRGSVSRISFSGQATPLYTFTGKDDGYGASALTYIPNQGLFGVTPAGSVADAGTVFHLDLSDQFTTLIRFGTVGSGYSPTGSLRQASDGSFYGTTRLGGGRGYGTIYHLTAAGVRTTLHEFGGDTDASPSLLILGKDGQLYGVTSGINAKGSVYRVDISGAFTTLHQFTDGADGAQATALIASQDGNLYGVATSSSASGNYGSFFRISPAGTFSVVRTFSSVDSVHQPLGLVEAEDGRLYGIAASSVFQIAPDGATIVLYNGFTSINPPSSLVTGVDGNLYGVTPGVFYAAHGGIVVAPGTLWRCTPDGTFTNLHLFNNTDALFGPTSLIPAASGDLYGVVGGGYPNDIIYRFSAGGGFEPLYRMPSVVSGLIQGLDGNLYGTSADYSGPLVGGALFRCVFGKPSAVNLATRMTVGTGNNVSIGGFIISGAAAKKVMLRGIGPSLSLAGKLNDPMLELRNASGTIIGRNDNWRISQTGGVVTGDQSSDIQGSGLAPSDDREAALIATLSPGSYTALLSGTQNTTGTGVVEIYDLDVEANAVLANISTRGFVGVGDDTLIGGLITDGSFYGRSKVIVRALGPSLAPFGVSNPLNNPWLTVYDQNGNGIAVNDDWQDTGEPEITSYGLAPKDPREAAVYLLLPGGNYTAVVTGNGGTGLALIETYNLP